MRTRISAVLLAIAADIAGGYGANRRPGCPPARSQDETVSLGYMRTVLYSQRIFKKKYGHYATSLAALVHSGSFTKRMATTDRGAYSVDFHGKPDAFSLALIPKQYAPDRRAFYADETGKIRVEEDKPATRGIAAAEITEHQRGEEPLADWISAALPPRKTIVI